MSYSTYATIREAKRCYAWSNHDPAHEQISAVLELPPVKTANDAVKVHIVQQAKQARKGKDAD